MQKASSDGVPTGPKSPPYLMSDAIGRNQHALIVGWSTHRSKVAAVPDERRNQTHSECTQNALSMHSDAISMQSACN